MPIRKQPPNLKVADGDQRPPTPPPHRTPGSGRPDPSPRALVPQQHHRPQPPTSHPQPHFPPAAPQRHQQLPPGLSLPDRPPDPPRHKELPSANPAYRPYRNVYANPYGSACSSPETPSFIAGRQNSSERLLPPGGGERFRDEVSPARSGYSSRRSSFSSQASRGSRMYSPNPFADSRSPSRAGSDEDQLNTQTVAQKYNILPTAGLILFPEDVEKDDYLHNPDLEDKNQRACDIFSKRGVTNIGGLILITLGVLTLFIGYPILTFVRKLEEKNDPCRGDPLCINIGPVPLFKNVRQGLIDPDTPDSAKTKTAADGSTQLQLVFSDEFNTDGRTFYPGDDPYFSAVDIWYGVTQDLEWYDPDAITTKDGALQIRMDAFQNHGLNYRSGMLQSWNQLCFQGGLLEASISLPGAGDVQGFWPGFWSMGNLGRPGFPASTEGLWPYSYDDVCDAGITPNQSMTDGISYLPGMRLPACTCEGESHPNPGKSRSAPEIDVLEASAGLLDGKNVIGQVSQSFQVAPFDIWWYPDYEYTPLYDPELTILNVYTGGPFQQALSAITNLNNDWYNGKQYQRYAYEYTPGDQGSLTWYVGEDKTWTIDARAIRPNGNVGQRMIPREPMAMVLNFGLSTSFVNVNFTGIGEQLPATMRFDYVRLYQDPNSQSVTCEPEDYPTLSYIDKFAKAYRDPNVTSWSKAGFQWPKNTLMDGC